LGSSLPSDTEPPGDRQHAPCGGRRRACPTGAGRAAARGRVRGLQPGCGRRGHRCRRCRSSVALVGFGLDSVVESFSGAVILWQFRHRLPETRERAALRLISVSFFALAAYVTVESVRSLTGTSDAESSTVGIGLAALSLVVMPVPSWAQRRTGRALGSGSVVANSKQTLLCTYLSAVLLAGLVLNATLGWSWADPLVALVIATVAIKEGLEAWRGDACSCE
jgi:divalent metal cation (Fe/Co/Zn/Cd) transporter